MRVAIAGKGGAGKSFLTGTLARILARQGRRVLVLDSDPMPGVSISLGMGPIDEDMLGDAVERGPDDRWRLKRGIGPVRAVRRFSRQGPDGVHLLQFGKAGGQGLAPIMGSVAGFSQVVRRLAQERALADWTLLGDLPAGPRQTAFDWAPYADRTVVVVEPTIQSILTAGRIARLVSTRGRSAVIPVANKVTSPDDAMLIADGLGLEIRAAIPLDVEVARADRLGLAILDHAPGARATEAVEALAALLSDGPGPDPTARDTLRARSSAGGRP